MVIAADCDTWQAGVVFGIHYAWEALPDRLCGAGARVTVTAFHGMPCDSKQSVAALAAALALFDAYGIKPSHPPRLDPEKGEIVFPKHPL